ncbi:hypothetical protein Btru_044599 [Bulinus truncatus]|nr:hypothetical protein Btru_044599 [Bulinus truncatus]
MVSGLQENSSVIRAITDSATHASIGALVWSIAENSAIWGNVRKCFNCLFCAILAAIVDVDHFIAAGSFNLKDALHLQQRPPFHNTSIIFLLVTLCWSLGHIRPTFKLFSLMFLASWLSHHLRDAHRRGLWIAPFGHTPALPTFLYISLIICLALVIRICYCYFLSNTVANYDMV